MRVVPAIRVPYIYAGKPYLDVACPACVMYLLVGDSVDS